MRHQPLPKLPFKVKGSRLFNEKLPSDERVKVWLEDLKKKARDNIKNNYEYMRIEWMHRFKVPTHPRFEDYTPEEIIIESWEIYYYENPNALELKGIFKKVNPNTGYKYYETGDPLIDAFEEAFGRGETPDLSALNNVKGGKDIFREPVFMHTESVVGGQARPGDMVAPRRGDQGVQVNDKGEKITVAGTKVVHDDYRSDDFVKDLLAEDPGLKALAERMLKDGR